jgi:hypothetical protein
MDKIEKRCLVRAARFTTKRGSATPQSVRAISIAAMFPHEPKQKAWNRIGLPPGIPLGRQNVWRFVMTLRQYLPLSQAREHRLPRGEVNARSGREPTILPGAPIWHHRRPNPRSGQAGNPLIARHSRACPCCVTGNR